MVHKTIGMFAAIDGGDGREFTPGYSRYIIESIHVRLGEIFLALSQFVHWIHQEFFFGKSCILYISNYIHIYYIIYCVYIYTNIIYIYDWATFSIANCEMTGGYKDHFADFRDQYSSVLEILMDAWSLLRYVGGVTIYSHIF